jgi:NAD(P)-dependent dehydrogenase (short-subunit alcohol dehydrogenase family)
MSLMGKTCLVAGASRGIGLAIAKEMARAGAQTTLAARSAGALEKEAAALREAGLAADTLLLDIKDEASILAAAQAKPWDVLINVAGTNVRKRLEEYTPEEYEHIFQTNLHGIVRLTRLIGPAMVKRGHGGKIVNIGSLTSGLGIPYLTIYAMTKSAIAGLTRTLAVEWARDNIQVNCIAPGFIETDLNREMWRAHVMRQWLSGAQANPRIGRPEDIAPLAVFLSGPGADYITGQTIYVDGGYSTTARWPFEPA